MAQQASGTRRTGEWLLLFFGLALASGVLEAAAYVIEHHAAPKEGYAPVRGHRSREPMNAAGYRDTEHAKARTPGVHRAVFLGDSFTYGVGVLLDDTYPKRAERALSAAGEPWESVVFATPGIDTEQEENILENEALAYSPDVVVVGYVLNDAEDENAAERRRAAQWQEMEEMRKHPPLWRRSSFLDLVANRLHATRENRDRIENHLALYRNGAAGFQSVEASMKHIAELCAERHIPLVVVIFPLFANPLDDTYPFAAVHHQVATLCRSVKATVIDLLPYYRDMDWRLLVVEGARDEHPNELAHRIAAQALVAGLEPLHLGTSLTPKTPSAGAVRPR